MSKNQEPHLQRITSLLRESLPDLEKEFGVTHLAIFGSLARGEFNDDSDIDLLVEFQTPPSLFAFLRLKRKLEMLLGHPVDLVTPNALREPLRPKILEERLDVT